MTREIKFRGKDIYGEWYYGYLFHGDNDCESYSLILDGKTFGCDRDMPAKYSVCFYENEVAVVKSDTVGQYTGLKDKNGKEIYEGDILHIIEYKNNGLKLFDHNELLNFSIEELKGEKRQDYYGIVRIEQSCMFVRDIYMDALWGDMRFSEPIYQIEVIGNIHDNTLYDHIENLGEI